MHGKKILVVCGGYSSEREVSIKTGENIFQSLQNQGHEAEVLVLSSERSEILEEIVNKTKDQKTNLVVNALHGEFGEDGHLQAILETLSITYTGSGVLASSLAMNKARLYDVLNHYKIRVPETITLDKGHSPIEVSYLKKRLTLPVIVKPNVGGSSIGVTKVNDWAELQAALNYSFESSPTSLVQEFVSGTEITCPVINQSPLIVGEIIFDKSKTIFDYDAKYSSDSTQEIFPGNLPDNILEQTQKLALQIHNIIGAKGLTRTDFIYNSISGEIVFLEINTCPGMTNSSLCPKSAQSFGWSFDRLVAEIIKV